MLFPTYCSKFCLETQTRSFDRAALLAVRPKVFKTVNQEKHSSVNVQYKKIARLGTGTTGMHLLHSIE